MTQQVSPNNDFHKDDEISLKELILKIRDWFKYLSSKWIVILMSGLLGTVIGVLYSTFTKPIYTAETVFVLEEENPGGGMLGQLGGLAGLAGVDIGGGGGGLFQGDNILELYKSRSMVEKTLLSEVTFGKKSQLLVDRYIDFNHLREVWDKKEKLKGIEFKQGAPSTRIQDSILGSIVKNINKKNLLVGKPDKKLGIIKVQVKAEDEFFAKAFNDQIVKNVNDFYVQTKTKKSLENLAILQHQTDSVRAVLSGAIFNTAAVADATPNLNPSRQILRAPAQRFQFNAEANKAILTQLIQNLELAKLSLRKETPLIQVVDKPIYPLEMERLGKFKGILYGGIIGGFFAVIFLLIRKLYSEMLNE